MVMPISFMWTVRYGMNEKDEHAKQNITNLSGSVFRFGLIQNCEKIRWDSDKYSENRELGDTKYSPLVWTKSPSSFVAPTPSYIQNSSGSDEHSTLSRAQMAQHSRPSQGNKLYFTVVRLNNVMYDEPCLTDRKIQNYPLSFPVEQDPVCQTLIFPATWAMRE